jgi:hypothetical protein
MIENIILLIMVLLVIIWLIYGMDKYDGGGFV